MSNKKLPKWFKGELYEEGDTVKNRFSGEEYKLTGAELSMYDFIIGSQLVMEMAPRMVEPRQIADFQKGLDWFRSHNAKAYMVLLD
jgi:hypothetical protein